MKRIHFLLLAFIFVSIAAKVSIAPVEMEYSALAADHNDQKVKLFFKYKVNHIQSYDDMKISRCKLKSQCCSPV